MSIKISISDRVCLDSAPGETTLNVPTVLNLLRDERSVCLFKVFRLYVISGKNSFNEYEAARGRGTLCRLPADVYLTF